MSANETAVPPVGDTRPAIARRIPKRDLVPLYGPIAMVLFLTVWEVGLRLSDIPELYLPRPTVIAQNLYLLFAEGGILQDLGVTLYRIFGGFFLAAVVGIVLGILMGTSRKLYAVCDIFIAVLYPIPKISLVPLLIIWFGSGDLFQIVLAALGCFFPVVINTILGVRQCDQGLILAARDLGANERQIKWKVVFPAAVPSIFSGLKLALGIAIIMVVAAEMLTAKYGLGARLQLAGQILETGQVFAILLLLAVLGGLLTKGQERIDRMIGRWRV